MKKPSKLSRTEQPASVGAQGSPAGTPTAATQSDDALPKTTAAAVTPAVTSGDSQPVGELSKTTQAASEAPAAAKPKPEKQNAVATPQRAGGAGWWIPPQRESAFGVK